MSFAVDDFDGYEMKFSYVPSLECLTGLQS